MAVLELVNLHVKADQEADFEKAFEQAKPLITKQKGFVSIELQRSVEEPDKYILLVIWDTIEDHMEGFVKSEELAKWREILDPLYESRPAMGHFNLVSSGSPT